MEHHLTLPQRPGDHQVSPNLTILGHPVAQILHHTVTESGLQVLHDVRSDELSCALTQQIF